MDIVEILSSVNKIGLVAFFITLGFLLYEIYLLAKTNKSSAKPNVPQFSEAMGRFPLSKKLNKIEATKKNKALVLLLVILLIIFGIISLIGFSNLKTVEISKGIRVFNRDFKPIRSDDLETIKEGETIIIGVETISGTDIDVARIRINSNVWRQDNITKNYAKNYNVFYTTYIIPTGISKLKIEAQLHSQKNGWLGN